MTLYRSQYAFTLRTQLRMLRKAWFAIDKHSDQLGYFWGVRTPLLCIVRSKNWIDFRCGERRTYLTLCWIPNIPLEDGGVIYRYEHTWA